MNRINRRGKTSGLPDHAKLGSGLKEGLDPIWQVMIYRQDVRVRRPIRLPDKDSEDDPKNVDQVAFTPRRGRIRGFSCESANRLVFAIRNAPIFLSKITLTYPGDFPADGHVVKRDIAAICKRLRRKGLAGIWYLEFQRRGAPHLHILVDGSVDGSWLSQAWYEVVGSGDVKHLRAGTHTRKIKEAERPENYAVKRISGAWQKVPPPEYANLGRFWAAFGRKMVEPVVLEYIATTLAPIIRIGRRAEHAARRARGIRRRQRDSGQWGRTIFGVARAVMYALSWRSPWDPRRTLFKVSFDVSPL